jgi:hypothetical protein
MANYETLKAAIQQVVKTNGNNEITGALLQQSLLSMINSLGVGYQFVGIATPSTNPGTPDQNVFYIASESGTYSNFGGLSVSDGEVAILKYNGTWTKEVTGAATAAQVTQLGQDVDDLEDKTETTIKHNRNLADSAIMDNGHYLDGYTRIAAESGCVSIIFPCKPSTKYTLSKIKTARFRVAYLPVYPNVLAQGAGRIASDNATNITITTAADSQYIFAWIYNSAGETQTIEAVMNSLQIEVGETATEYVAPAWSAIDVDARAEIVHVSERVDVIEQQVGPEVDELESDLKDLDTFVRGASSFQIATDLTATLISGYKIDTNGYAVGDVVNMTPSAFPGYAYAVYPIKAGQTFVVSGIGGNGPRLWGLVDVDYKFIDQATAGGKTREPITASVDGYIIYNTQPSSSTYPPFLLRFDYDITTQKYRGQDGPIASQNGNYYTDPIYLHKGATIAVNAETSSTNYALVSKVSESGEYISTLLQSALSGVHQTITLSETCYISISSSYAHATGFVITDVSLEQRVDDLAVDAETVSPAADTKLPAITDNPLDTIRRDAGYGSIIRKWGIIGDSLSSGEMQCYNEESTSSSDYKFIDMYQYSTGQVLARLLGAEAYNFSNGGQTTWGWLKSQGVVRDETYIGGVGGGDWRLAQQSEYIKDGYIIAMGVNDRSKIVNGDYELGTTSQITTYNGTDSDIDDTTTYPKSFVRYYAGIIQRILSVQPKAKIFCVTPLGDNYAEIAQAIRDIVTYFGGNVYLMDIREYIPDGYDVAGFKLQGHLSPMGYAYWAYMYNTYIDWIIRNNGNAFRDTALIGTDYRPDYS